MNNPIIPYEKHTLYTSYPMEQLPVILQEAIKEGNLMTSRTAAFMPDAKPFIGKVTADDFSIMRIIRYKNSFRPIIKGKFHDDLSRRRIDVTMSLHPTAILALGIFFVVAISIGLRVVTEFLQTGSLDISNMEGLIGILLPISMLVVLPVIGTISFKYEARKAHQFLIDTFMASEF